MKNYRTDFHIHTLLSPCGSLEMSPCNIIHRAREMQLDIIAITDHNATHHCALAAKLGSEAGIMVIAGAEVTTREEVHCLALFETDEAVTAFQAFLDAHLPFIPNNPEKFGDQVVIDEEEMIIEQPAALLLSALTAGIDEVERQVHALNGLFIPAHINRPSYSLISQLGFVPVGLKADAMEVHRKSNLEEVRATHRIDPSVTLLKSSDAHHLQDIGKGYSEFYMAEATFSEIRLALAGLNGRKAVAA
jgi:3',5'-nucleoside bisphosphate phosphatase